MIDSSSHIPNISIATPRDPASLHVAIIGAGLSGLMCARALRHVGVRARIFDKGRAPGGRCSTRRASTDSGVIEIVHGLPTIDTSSSCLSDWLKDLEARGLLTSHGGSWVGAPTFAPLIDALTAELSVQNSVRVQRISREDETLRLEDERGHTLGGFTHVVCSAPAPQTAALLASVAPKLSQIASDVETRPIWTLLLTAAPPLHATKTSIEDITDETSPLSKIIITPPQGEHGLVGISAHANARWSRDHLDASSDVVLSKLLTALEAHFGQPLASTYARTHRWRYAFAASHEHSARALADRSRRVYACGDWLANGRADGAILSGIEAANALLSSTEQS